MAQDTPGPAADTVKLQFDRRMTYVTVRAASKVFAEQLRGLPRSTECDGSLWVSSHLLDEIATKLESL